MSVTKEDLIHNVKEALGHSRAELAGEAFGVPEDAIDQHREYIATDVVDALWDWLNA